MREKANEEDEEEEVMQVKFCSDTTTELHTHEDKVRQNIIEYFLIHYEKEQIQYI